MGLKRDSSHLDTDDESRLSQSTKRLKVAFSPTVDVRTIADDYSEKSFDLVKEEVRQGIEGHLAPADRRDDKRYAGLLELLGKDVESDEAPSSKLLKKYLLATIAKISSLGHCAKLATTLLELSWLGRDDTFVALYMQFLITLATAHSKYIPAIMENLASHFARLPAATGRLQGETPVSRAIMFGRVHAVLKMLLQRIPSATTTLVLKLKAEFPNDLATTRSYIQYQRQLLRLAESMPEIKAEILALLIQRLVSIDEQIQLDYDDLEDDEEEALLQTKQAPKVDDIDNSDDESVSESEETMTEDEQRQHELNLKVEKLDATMDLLFAHYTPLVQGGLKADLNDAYQQLLSHFETFILPHRTRHAQFLVFHFSQTLPEHGNLFARQCLHSIFDGGRPLSLRLHACAYLASFAARGAHLPTTIVREIFSGLCQQLDSMRKRYEPACRGPDKRTYAVYYAIAQAILYIFCFRWRDLALGAADPEAGDEDSSEEDLLAEGRELAWLPAMKETLQQNIQSRLNPLKVCSPAIVGEFAKLAHHVRFLYIFSIIETNKRVRLTNAYAARPVSEVGRRETAMDRKLGEAHLQLEAYFPFDPYTLPMSKHWVAGDYNEWEDPAGMKQDNEAEPDNDEEESDEDSDEGYEEDDMPDADDVVSVSS
ncbi:DNA independent RNA polymerase I transcription factor [Recurvomyces mirabilis]|uniref:DNA independent RNA polymerase I transcription factor n=1 Tax=Recurvomyces mirabilis TaxID=574656 RepID=A0AAE0WQ18_9PEZI|nr:DNA independent RNA polymerase I transcription factor [Recurvomyces mirabilis]KAK5155939.1 DNA independent RNA polymerase I transcription factor [Recurvomyces mirabilis]